MGLLFVLVGMVYWTFVAPNFNARVALVSAYHAGLYGVLGLLMLTGRPANRPRYSFYFLATAALLLCLGHTTRRHVRLAQMMARAHRALYTAKAAGRDRVMAA